jgi:hypothetical protein
MPTVWKPTARFTKNVEALPLPHSDNNKAHQRLSRLQRLILWQVEMMQQQAVADYLAAARRQAKKKGEQHEDNIALWFAGPAVAIPVGRLFRSMVDEGMIAPGRSSRKSLSRAIRQLVWDKKFLDAWGLVWERLSRSTGSTEGGCSLGDRRCLSDRGKTKGRILLVELTETGAAASRTTLGCDCYNGDTLCRRIEGR